jgi:hypothetical protein
LYCGLKTEVLNFNKNSAAYRKYKRRHATAGCIFAACLHEILLDLIDNNVIFVAPCTSDYSELSVDTIEGEKFKKLYNAGVFGDLDYVKSEMRGHTITYKIKRKNSTLKCQVSLDNKLQERLTKKSEQGNSYY